MHPDTDPDLPALKERLLIPLLWRRLGLPGEPRISCKSPFRADRSPSFSIYAGGRRWKDHATGDGGDAIDFLAHACHLDKAEAMLRFRGYFGLPQRQDRAQKRTRSSARTAAPPPVAVALPATEERRLAVARSRGLSSEAVALAESLRTLRYGRVCGYACWILGDESGPVAEARRLDGQPFPAVGNLGARKAHTLRGSDKSWPCGAGVLRRNPHFRRLLLVEGGPDYLAALHLLLRLGRWDTLPVAVLGRSTGTRLNAGALALMAGHPVLLAPHADADGGGLLAAQRWATQLQAAGCPCDFFDFRPLHQAAGCDVKDLNDAALATPHLSSELKQTLENIIA